MKLINIISSPTSPGTINTAKKALREGIALTAAERALVLEELEKAPAAPLIESDPFLGAAEILTHSDLVELGLSDDEIADLDTGGDRQPGVSLTTGKGLPATSSAPTAQIDPPPASLDELHDELDAPEQKPATKPKPKVKPEASEEEDRKGLAEGSLVLKPFSRPKPRKSGDPTPRAPKYREPVQLEEGLVTRPVPRRNQKKSPAAAIPTENLDSFAMSLIGIK